MLPQETSVRQLKKLRAETKGTDIGDLTKNDRLNHNIPNLQYIGNPIDTGIESWQEFCQKDSSVQTIAFKSKLVNKPIVKENKKENMKDIKTFEDFEDAKESMFYKNKRNDVIDIICNNSDCNRDELENMSDAELDDLYYDLELDTDLVESVKKFEKFDDEDIAMHNWKDSEYAIIKKMEDDEEQEFFERTFDNEEIEEIDELETDDDIFDDEESINDEDEDDNMLRFNDDLLDDEEFIDKSKLFMDFMDERIKTFEAFSVPAAKKEEKQPEYTILGEEKEPKSNPNFGYAAVRSQEIKKISDFNLIDPPTPKERTIGGSAGVFIDNGTVKGFVNRIEGKDAYIESVDDPMVIKKFNLKDVVKNKKSE